MKKLIFLLLAVALLAACSKKKEVKPPLTPVNATAADLVGKWSLVADTVYITTNGQTTSTVDNTNTGGVIFQFNADGSGSETVAGKGVSFVYRVSNGIVSLHVPASANSTEADLSLTITVITATKLVLKTYDTDGATALALVKDR